MSSIKENFNKYENVEEVLNDLRQIWENCRLFNAEGSDISATADLMDSELEGLIEVCIFLFFYCNVYFFNIFLYLLSSYIVLF